MFLHIVVQMGHDVGGNFNMHIWAYSGDFSITNRYTDKFVRL